MKHLLFLPFLFLLLSLGPPPELTDPNPPLKRITTVDYQGRPHFRIRTRMATYLYDIAGGGFSSIIDRQGNDWVGFKPEPRDSFPAAAASSYRGVPNFVFGEVEEGGAGHPGFDKCESRVVGRNQIHTVSLSGKWAWTVTFYRDCAKFDVIQTDPDQPYWFLYEGTVGGSYRPKSTYWATDLTDPVYTIHDHFQEDSYTAAHQYFLFGEDESPYSLFMYQKDSDATTDHFSLLGNEEIGAENSPDGMVVAGFGRGTDAKPLLSGNNTFLIGLMPYNLTQPESLQKARNRVRRLANQRFRQTSR